MVENGLVQRRINSLDRLTHWPYNTLIVVVIKWVVKQAAGHCVAVLLCSCPFPLLTWRSAGSGNQRLHPLDLLEVINLSSLQPKGCCLQPRPGKKTQPLSTVSQYSEWVYSELGMLSNLSWFTFSSSCIDGAEDKLTSMLRETPRDSVLLPQEHKRQTREKVFGSAESYAKDSSQYTVYQWNHTWVITVLTTTNLRNT